MKKFRYSGRYLKIHYSDNMTSYVKVLYIEKLNKYAEYYVFEYLVLTNIDKDGNKKVYQIDGPNKYFISIPKDSFLSDVIDREEFINTFYQLVENYPQAIDNTIDVLDSRIQRFKDEEM